MKEWIIEYDVIERSRFQARAWGEDESEALANFRDQAEAAGYGEAGTWMSTEDVTPVLDSIQVEEVTSEPVR